MKYHLIYWSIAVLTAIWNYVYMLRNEHIDDKYDKIGFFLLSIMCGLFHPAYWTLVIIWWIKDKIVTCLDKK